MRPVPSKHPVTLGYRQQARFDPNYIHRGIDYGCPSGTPVVATRAGTVVWAGDARSASVGSYGPAYGIQVIIKVGTIYCLYAHLSTLIDPDGQPYVKRGDTVKLGEVIGKSGATGNVRGAHLHYQECTEGPPAYKSDRKPQFTIGAAPKPTPESTPNPAWPDAPAHWYPFADRKTQNFTGNFSSTTMDTNCVILHSTEGTGWPGYNNGGSAPHMTIMPDFKNKKVIVRQHLAGNKSARALENRSGGVETNTANVFQIEMVGTCDPRTHTAWRNLDHIYMAEPPQWYLDGVADVMKWLDKQYPKFKIVDGAPRGWSPYPASYGATKFRFTRAEWDKFYGIAGHQHVPENNHGDPGNFPIKKLIDTARGVTPAPAPGPDPEPTPDPVDPRMDPKNYGPGKTGDHITWLGERLVLHGFGKHYKQGPGPTWGAADELNVRDFQLAQGWSGSGANGLPGPETLKRLAADPIQEPTPEPEEPDFEPAPEIPDPQVKVRMRAAIGNANVYWMGKWDARADNVAAIFKKAGASVALIAEMYSGTAGGRFVKEMGWGDADNQVDVHATPRPTDCYDIHGGPHSGVKLGAFWDPTKRRILELEDFWTTSNPVRRNSGSMAVLLKDIETGHLSIWIPLHLEFEPVGKNYKSHWGNKRRYDQANAAFTKGRALAAKWAKQYNVKRIPVFVGGDMNGDQDDPYDGPGVAAKKHGFVDSDDAAEKRVTVGSTHAKAGGLKPGGRIDRWFVEKWVRVIEQETHNAYPHTDHNVVEIYVEFDNN